MSRAATLPLSLLVAGLVAFGAAPAARAYVAMKYGSNELKWGSTNVTYYIHTNGSADVTASQLEGAIAGAFQAWQAVTCSTISFTYGGRRSSDPRNGIFIRFQESNWDPSVGDAAAYSVPTSYSGGVIRATEIVFNGQDITWTTDAAQAASGLKSDIQGVAAHEIGHSLGLEHTRHIEATMFFSSGLSAELRTLADDDQRGICYLYPNGSFRQGQVCDSCRSNDHCAVGTCITYYRDPEYYCGQSCTTDAGCPDGYFCYTDDGLNQCVPDNAYCDDSGTNVPIGGFCYGYSVCQSGLLCLATGQTAYCSRACPPACPSGMECLGGYCLQGGTLALGAPCQSSYECASLTCATMSPGVYVCASDCATDADCPAGFGCAWEMCFRTGATPFGQPCDRHTDCASAYCAGYAPAKYCSDDCRADADCPLGAYCTASGYCSKVNIVTGGPCLVSGDCPDGDFCRYDSETAAHGTCATECNPYTGESCPAGQVCAWVEMAWVQRIKGECKPRNRNPSEGADCDPAVGCEWDAVCARHDGGPYRCWAHCRADMGTGCTGGALCLPVHDPASPNHGFCWVAPPPPPPDTGRTDTGQPRADSAQPPVDAAGPRPDTGAPRPDTGGGPPGADTGSGGPPGADAAAGPDGGGGGTGGGGGGGGGGGCAAGGGAAGGAGSALLLLALLGVRLRRRRRVGAR
jgi:hypothetical protein